MSVVRKCTALFFTGCLRSARSRSIAALRGDLCRGEAAGEARGRDRSSRAIATLPAGNEGNLRAEVVQHAASAGPVRPSSRPGKTRKRTRRTPRPPPPGNSATSSRGCATARPTIAFHMRSRSGTWTAPRPARGVYVVTHVDVIPPRKDDAVGLLKKPRRGEPAATTATCATRFVQQTNRPNHFTVVENLE